ncbi:MAG TPA: co-chaperone GroES [Ktedonobacterales bacterium]|nr:co-chaperone GroES [Ktedonobacterales bacterium]
MKTIQPLGDRALIKVIEAPTQTASGLYLPDTSKERPTEGEVVAVGDGEIISAKLSVGEHVLFQKFAGSEVKLDDGQYVILSESDILGRIVEVEQITSGAA